MDTPNFICIKEEQKGSDPFLWAKGIAGVKKHRMMSVQYGNSVMSQWIVY